MHGFQNNFNMTIPLHTLLQTIITFHLVLLSLLTDLTVHPLSPIHPVLWKATNMNGLGLRKQNQAKLRGTHRSVEIAGVQGAGGRSKREHEGKWWRKNTFKYKDNTFYDISMKKTNNQWLPISFRIKSRLVAMTYKVLHYFYVLLYTFYSMCYYLMCLTTWDMIFVYGAQCTSTAF